MAADTERYIQLAHHVPGRTRVRLAWLREQPEEAQRVAKQLAELEGIREVRVQPHTGSVLCLHEPTLELEAIVQELQRITEVKAVLMLGEKKPPLPQPPPRGSGVGNEIIGLFRQIDRDVMRATSGHLGLATLTVAAFAGVGVVNTAVTGTLPLPPWYSLAWWSFRTLWTVEREMLRSGGVGSSAPDAPQGG